MRWVRQPEHEAQLRPMFEDQGFPEASIPKVFYGFDGDTEVLHALVARDDLGTAGGGAPDWRWHISISAEGRVPAWSEVAEAGHDLRPGIVFVLGVPPKSWWINVHPNVLHLWEVRDDRLVDAWRSERRGDAPS
jgi:hypothetical protein